MSRTRVACVGTGFIAGKHLAALLAEDDVDVVAVADTEVARAEAVAGRIGARAYADGLDLLASEDLDAVWLCVPPFAHGALERAAVGRGLPFFVEKPLAEDLDTALAVAELVRRSGLLTAVGYHWRYLSVVEEARGLLTGRPPVLALGHWLDATPAAPWWAIRSRSGGQVLEQATHLLDLARALVGEVDTVQALEVAPGRDGAGAADAVPLASCATLCFASGALGTLTSARFLPGRHRVALQLLGDGYAVELAERSLDHHTLSVSTADGARVRSSDEDPIAREDRAFLDAVRGRDDDVRSPYQEALGSHRLAWTVDRSGREGGRRLRTRGDGDDG